MTAIPNNSTIPTNPVGPPHALADFPVGGADPDFVVDETSKPLLCTVPMLGQMLPQCK